VITPTPQDRLKPAACLIGAMPGLQFLFKTKELCLNHPQLADEISKGLARQCRSTIIFLIFDYRD